MPLKDGSSGLSTECHLDKRYDDNDFDSSSRSAADKSALTRRRKSSSSSSLVERVERFDE